MIFIYDIARRHSWGADGKCKEYININIKINMTRITKMKCWKKIHIFWYILNKINIENNMIHFVSLRIRSSLFNFMNSYHALALKVWINIFSLVLPLMLRTSWYEHKCTCTLRLSFCNLFCDKLILIKTGLCIETFMNCCLGIDD